MKTVRFKAPFFIEGTRYERGLQAVKDEHLDRLPSTAVILDDNEAEKAKAEQEAINAKARDPKTLKEMRSGRGQARPMGKQEPKKAPAKADPKAE